MGLAAGGTEMFANADSFSRAERSVLDLQRCARGGWRLGQSAAEGSGGDETTAFPACIGDQTDYTSLSAVYIAPKCAYENDR